MRFIDANKTNANVSANGYRISKLTNTFLLVIALASVSGCKKSSEQLPPNSTVVVNPSEISWEIASNGGVCNYDPSIYQDHTVSIMVVNESGNYIPDAPLMVSLDLSGNTFSGVPVLALYEDKNGNGVADSPSELVTDSGDEAYDTRTDLKTGHKYLILRVNLSCSYRGVLYVFSDGYMGTVSVAVTEREE